MIGTLSRVANAASIREERWNEFLASLKPWELHKLNQGEQELLLHDEYVMGAITLKDIRLTLSFDPTPIDPLDQEA